MNVTQTVSTSNRAAPATAFWRSAGVWMAVILVGFQLFNVARVAVSPAAFAEYFGLPLGAADSGGFVWVYAIRTLFIAVFGAALLLRRDRPTLAVYALVAIIAPVGDALLVALNAGPQSVVIRHVLTAAFVAATWWLLQRVR